MDSDLIFRPYELDDIAFIYSSWARSSYKGSNAHKLMRPSEYHALHRPTIDQLFARPTATIVVATYKEEPSIILGWIAVEVLENKVVIHYLYVKADFRFKKDRPFQYQIATKLVDRIIDKDKPVIFTHTTYRAAQIIANNPGKYIRFTYLPLT